MLNLFNLLAEPTTPPAEGGNNPVMIVILCVLGALIIGMFIWSTISGRKKQREAQAMVDGIKIGDKVKTIGGICGYVAEINDEENSIVLQTGLDTNKSFIKFDKGAIYQTAPANAPVEEKVEPKAEVKEAPVKVEKKAKKANAEEKTEEVKSEEVASEEAETKQATDEE